MFYGVAFFLFLSMYLWVGFLFDFWLVWVMLLYSCSGVFAAPVELCWVNVGMAVCRILDFFVMVGALCYMYSLLVLACFVVCYEVTRMLL